MLTAGQYLNDLSAARRGLEPLRPLLVRADEAAYNSIRIEIRKPPVSGIRKACSKIIKLLEEGGNGASLAKAKGKIYETIKLELTALDDGCRPDMQSRPDLSNIITQLETSLDDFSKGLVVVAESALEPTPAPAAAETNAELQSS